MVSQSTKAAEVIASSKNAGPAIREISGREQFDAAKRVGKHSKLDREVRSPTSSTPYAMEASQLELAKLGVYFKGILEEAGIGSITRPMEKLLLAEIVEKDTWVSFANGEKVYFKGHPDLGRKASLLNKILSWVR